MAARNVARDGVRRAQPPQRLGRPVHGQRVRARARRQRLRAAVAPGARELDREPLAARAARPGVALDAVGRALPRRRREARRPLRGQGRAREGPRAAQAVGRALEGVADERDAPQLAEGERLREPRDQREAENPHCERSLRRVDEKRAVVAARPWRCERSLRRVDGAATPKLAVLDLT
jgi:hypothetical protein